MKPKRLQRSRRKGYRLPDGAVCVDRSTKWGNPFPMNDPKNPKDRQRVIDQFEMWLTHTSAGRVIAEQARETMDGGAEPLRRRERMTVKTYPLSWPEGWPRTAARKSSAPYKTSFLAAYSEARNSLRLFSAIGVVISTDVPLKRDGTPYNDGDPPDPGVAVYFTRGKTQYVIACDRYAVVRHNMRAIGLALEGLRAVERSGATQVLDRAFAGFAQLPSGAGSGGNGAPALTERRGQRR